MIAIVMMIALAIMMANITSVRTGIAFLHVLMLTMSALNIQTVAVMTEQQENLGVTLICILTQTKASAEGRVIA